MQRIDIKGLRFGRLLVGAYAGGNKWTCTCDCGEVRVVSSADLRTRHTRSCGCLRKELISARVKTHGMAGSRTYETWLKMWSRCTKPATDQYKHYGGRGVIVCAGWKEFAAFFADMGERPAGMTLDRYPNNDGNYEPSNCRWATQKEQMDNTRRSVRFEGKTLEELSAESGIQYATLSYRLRKFGTPFPAHLKLKKSVPRN
jgi:hypothetical protein